MLSEPNVKVVFHQTAVPVTPLSTWIIYPKRSVLGHSTRCLAEAWLSEVDSIFFSRCRTCCSIDSEGSERSSYMDPFLSVIASAFPGRAGIFDYFIRKSRQSPKAFIPIGQRAERRGNHTTAVDVFPSDKTHCRPFSVFFVFDENWNI